MKKLSIRKQLLILMASIAIPMAALLIYAIYDNTKQRTAQAEASAERFSIVAASDVAKVLETNKEMLEQMAKRPLIKAVDAKRCDNILWDFKELFPKSANMTVIDIDGNATCSAMPQPDGKAVNVAKTEFFQRSLREKGFVVGKPFFGPITGRWVTVLTYPIVDDNLKLVGFLGLPLDLVLYKPNLSAAPLAPDTTAGVITSDGVFVWRNKEAEKWVGRSGMNAKAINRMLSVKNGKFISVGVDGIERLYFVTPVAGVDWYAYYGIPLKSIYNEAKKEFLKNTALAGGAFIFFIGFAVFIARRIEEPIHQLSIVARMIKGGKTDVRVDIDGSPEIVEVANEFNEMLDVRLKLKPS